MPFLPNGALVPAKAGTCSQQPRLSSLGPAGVPERGLIHVAEWPRDHYVAPYFRAGSEVRHYKIFYKIFTARAARRATIESEISACTIINTFAQRERIAVSVGESAVLVLNDKNR